MQEQEQKQSERGQERGRERVARSREDHPGPSRRAPSAQARGSRLASLPQRGCAASDGARAAIRGRPGEVLEGGPDRAERHAVSLSITRVPNRGRQRILGLWRKQHTLRKEPEVLIREGQLAELEQAQVLRLAGRLQGRRRFACQALEPPPEPRAPRGIRCPARPAASPRTASGTRPGRCARRPASAPRVEQAAEQQEADRRPLGGLAREPWDAVEDLRAGHDAVQVRESDGRRATARASWAIRRASRRPALRWSCAGVREPAAARTAARARTGALIPAPCGRARRGRGAASAGRCPRGSWRTTTRSRAQPG